MKIKKIVEIVLNAVLRKCIIHPTNIYVINICKQATASNEKITTTNKTKSSIVAALF